MQSEVAFNGGEGENFGTKRQKTKINIETAWPSVKIAKCRRDNFVSPYSAVRIRWGLKSCSVTWPVGLTQSGGDCSQVRLS